MKDPRRGRDFTKSTILFVEGLDEVNVFDVVSRQMGRSDVEARDVGGKDQLAVRFESAVNQSSFSLVKSFGIVQDADLDPQAAFDRVAGVLTKHKFPVPGGSGQVANDGVRRVGVLILPGDGRSGCLETLFLDEYRAKNLMSCVDTFVQCSEGNGSPVFDDKRRAYAMLCALDAPESRLGKAFEAGTVTVNDSAYDRLRDFIRQL